MTEAQITARAAEMAEQFWVEVEAHLAWQIAQCRAELPTQRRMPDQPPLHDHPTWRDWPPIPYNAIADPTS